MKLEQFEDLCRRAKLTPVKKITYPECEVFIADGKRDDRKDDYPNGYFRTMWATSRDGLDVGSHIEFDAAHDMGRLIFSERKDARVNAAIKAAEEFIGLSKKAGRYDS